MDRYRRHQCRYLSLGKNVSVRKVIELSLKAFQLPPDEENDFYLVEINERDGSEHRLDSNTSFKRQLQFETRRPQIILRYIEREENRDYINVYPGSLTYAYSRQSLSESAFDSACFYPIVENMPT